MIWLVIWVVLMILWLCGGGVYAYKQPADAPIVFGASTLLPWVCVLILGLVLFGAVSVGAPMTLR